MAMPRTSGLFVAVFIAGLARTVQGACPNNLADCLGSAAAFDVVAEKLSMNRGIVCEDGCGPVPSLTRDACAGKALVGGPTPALSGIGQLSNLIAVGAFPFPVAFVDQTGYFGGIGVKVLGDVVTGGGRVRGLDNVTILGVVDESGADPRVGTCAAAGVDMRAASDTLAALTPTASLGSVNLAPDEFMEFEAGPGVNVVEMSELTLRARTPRFDQVIYSEFGIVLDPATEAVVINTAKVSLGAWCSIYVFGGDPAKVIINVPGGQRVVFGVDSTTYPTVLAPRSTVGFHFGHARQVFARKVLMRGGCIGQLSHAYCHIY